MDGREHDGDFTGDAPEVFDFLEEVTQDLEEGSVHPLRHYLARFPGHEEAIAREYLALTTPAAEPSVSAEAAAKEAARVTATADGRVGPYTLLSEIGRGGQGVVYLAEDSRIARRVALKVLPPAALFLSQDRRQRLRREAEVVSRLDHPGICGIFDAEIEGELAYIAMPYVEGRTLASAIGEAREERAPEGVPFALAPQSDAELMPLLAFFEAAARALHSAHEAGIVHRDVKPGNLMVTPEGKPVWLDFGQARDAQSSLAELTLSGEIFGTPAYMSPEQVMDGAIDRRTDVWSLGVSLFEALTLRRPFEASTAQRLMLAIQVDEPNRARDFNPRVEGELAVVLATALERDLTRRYKSALDLAEDLARLQRREPIAAQPASRRLRARRWVQRYPVLFALICVVSVSLVAVSWLLYEQVQLVQEKDDALLEKEQKLVAALGRHKAQRAEALLSEDPASALIVAIEAVELAPNALTREALFAALEQCQLRAVYEAGDKKRFADLCLVPGRDRVAAVRFDGTAMLFERETGRELATWEAHAPGEESEPGGRVVAASRDGRYVATGGSDGRVVVRDLDEEASAEYPVPGGAIVRLEFELEPGQMRGKLCVRADEGDTVWLDVGAPLSLLLDEGADDRPPWVRRVPQLACLLSVDDPSGRSVFVVGEFGDGPVQRLIDTTTGEGRELPWRPAEVPRDAAFSPDGTRLAVVDGDGGLRLWDVATLQLLSHGRGYLKPSEVEWSDDGRYVLTHQGLGPQARLWYGTERPDVYTLRGERDAARAVAFADDGQYAVSSDVAGRRFYWSTPTTPGSGDVVGQLVERFESSEREEPPRGIHEPTPTSVLDQLGIGRGALYEPLEGGFAYPWGKAERHSAAPARGAALRMWPAGKLEGTLDQGPTSRFVELNLFVDLNEHRLHLSDAFVVQHQFRWAVELEDVRGDFGWAEATQDSEAVDRPLVVDVAFDPTGRYAAIARADRRIDFVDLADGSAWREPLAVFPPAGVDWSADGRRLLVWGRTGRGAFRVEDLYPEDGERGAMRAEDFHAGDLAAACFSADGTLALTASRDGTILVRDVSGALDPRSTRVVAHLRGSGSPVTCAVFSRGEGPVRVLAGFEDGTARVWPVDPLPPAIARRPRAELRDWERAREERFARAVQLGDD